MEARLLHIRKYLNLLTKTTAWHVVRPEKRGLPVSFAQFSNSNPGGGLMTLNGEAAEFLTDLAGKGGVWEGWTLHAVNMMEMGTLAGQYGAVPVRFDAVFVREAFARSRRDEKDDRFKMMGMGEPFGHQISSSLGARSGSRDWVI